jgi:hypothetical protein
MRPPPPPDPPTLTHEASHSLSEGTGCVHPSHLLEIPTASNPSVEQPTVMLGKQPAKTKEPGNATDVGGSPVAVNMDISEVGSIVSTEPLNQNSDEPDSRTVGEPVGEQVPCLATEGSDVEAGNPQLVASAETNGGKKKGKGKVVPSVMSLGSAEDSGPRTRLKAAGATGGGLRRSSRSTGLQRR